MLLALLFITILIPILLVAGIVFAYKARKAKQPLWQSVLLLLLGLGILLPTLYTYFLALGFWAGGSV
jgi:RsiW-degrading membrane proteinase PrsW (M82 family)